MQLLSGWWKWWFGFLVLGSSKTFPELQWPQVYPIVATRLNESPMAKSLQASAGLPRSYAYYFSLSGNQRDTNLPQSQKNSNEFSERSGVAVEAEDTSEVNESRGRSPEVQPRFIGKFKEWYKGKEKEKEDDDHHHIIISTIASHSHDHDHHDSIHHSDHGHGHNHGFGHDYYGGHHHHGYPHHHLPPPIYHYPHQHQQPVVQPIFIESGRGKGKKKPSKVTPSTILTQTVVVTQSQPVILTQTVTKPVIHRPSHIYIHSHKPVYVTPSHVHLPHTQTEYITVSIESDDHGWGWGWDIFDKGEGHGHGIHHIHASDHDHYGHDHHYHIDEHGHYGDDHHHHIDEHDHFGDDHHYHIDEHGHYTTGHYHHKGKQIVYVVKKPDHHHHHHHGGHPHTATQVIVQAEVPVVTQIHQPTTSQIMIMETPSYSIKKGIQKVRDTFKAFGDGIKDVGEDIKDKFFDGVHDIKSKLSFKGNDDHHHHYAMVNDPHSVMMVKPDVTKTVIVQKPLTQTVASYPSEGSSGVYMGSSYDIYKGGSLFKGKTKGRFNNRGYKKSSLFR